LRSYDNVLNEIDTLLAQATPGSAQYAQLVASKEQALTGQRTLLNAVQGETAELTRLKLAVEEINTRIRTIKSNTGNTQ
jgi:hypothetical protein